MIRSARPTCRKLTGHSCNLHQVPTAAAAPAAPEAASAPPALVPAEPPSGELLGALRTRPQPGARCASGPNSVTRSFLARSPPPHPRISPHSRVASEYACPVVTAQAAGSVPAPSKSSAASRLTAQPLEALPQGAWFAAPSSSPSLPPLSSRLSQSELQAALLKDPATEHLPKRYSAMASGAYFFGESEAPDDWCMFETTTITTFSAAAFPLPPAAVPAASSTRFLVLKQGMLIHTYSSPADACAARTSSAPPAAAARKTRSRRVGSHAPQVRQAQGQGARLPTRAQPPAQGFREAREKAAEGQNQRP